MTDNATLIIVAAIASVPPTLVGILTHIEAAKKIEQVHGIVNSKMTTALNKIDALEKQVTALGGVVPKEEP